MMSIDKEALPMVMETPLLTFIFTWDNSLTDLVQQIDVPPGILTYAIAWSHTTTTNHEEGGWFIIGDSPDIPLHPSRWDPSDALMPARFFIPYFVKSKQV